MKILILLILICLNSAAMEAQATANFTASATITQPIGIKTVSNLNFAEIDAHAGGEVVITPQEERIALGNVILENDYGVTAAAFQVTGQEGFAYSISLPVGPFFLSNGEEQMMIKNFTSSAGDSGDLTSFNSSFKVGATLVVNSNQDPGSYSTTSPMNVTVNYN